TGGGAPAGAPPYGSGHSLAGAPQTWPARRTLRGCGSDLAAAGQIGEPVRAVLGGAHEAVGVDVHDPEALGVAEAPFEVVHQGPHEVAAHVRAGLPGIQDGADVVAHVLHPVLVVHRLAARTAGFGHDLVGEGRAVLGDHHGQPGVAVVQVEEQIGQSTRVDVPAHIRLGAGLRE